METINPGSDPWMDPPRRLRIIIPFIPPTSNSIYVTIWKQKRVVKSKEAVAFQNRFLSEVVPKYLPWLSKITSSPETIYRVTTHLYLDQWDIFNKGWFLVPKKAATRYKKMDTGNRLKLVHDCLSEAIGVDDSHFFCLGADKLVAQEHGVEPQVHLYLEVTTPPKDPIKE